MAAALQLDGAVGEGGGQVLRTALGLSLLTLQPFTLTNIRARRRKPGLQRQHLAAVLAAAAVGEATTAGAELSSQHLEFAPRRRRDGDYRFPIGTAGSTTLVLQTVLPALFAADAPSTLQLEGGTHNPLAPSFDFLQLAFAPLLARMGAKLELVLERHGFHPAGGGRLTARVAPAQWRPLELLDRGAPAPLTARIVLSRIPRHVAEREARELGSRLDLEPHRIAIDEVPSPGPGNAVIVHCPSAHITEVVTALGARGVRAEDVAAAAATEARQLLQSPAPVGEHLADQLLIPLALAGSGAFRTVAPSPHTRTNAEVIERFLPVRFEFRDEGATWVVSVHRA